MVSTELRKVNLYLSNGYADMNSMVSYKAPVIIVLGGRGTGKTYGALKDAVDNNKLFLYMRRTQKQLDLAASETDNTFDKYNRDTGHNILPLPVPKTNNYNWYECDYDQDGKPVPKYLICSGISLSGMAAQRGFSAEGYDLLLFDEIIRQSDEKRLFDEGEAFLNAYESINRNREIEGKQPLKVVMLANTNTPNSDILAALGLLDLVDLMRKKRIDRWEDENSDIAVFNLKDSPISKKKANTLIYRISKNKKFNSMALENKFSEGTYEHIVEKTPPIKEYTPLVTWENITIYQHKSDIKFYVCRHKSGSCPEYHDLPTEKTQFLSLFGSLAAMYDIGQVSFKDFASKQVFLSIFE